MGSSTAILLARRGYSVTLFDCANAPVSGASRWNEGKIHLGFLYNADPSLQTAQKVIPGGLMFKPLVEDLIGCSLDPVITNEDDVYLCHRDSVVSPPTMWDYFQKTAQLIEQHPDARRYLTDVSSCHPRQLTRQQLAAITDSPSVVAGFRVPERSVSTNWIADRLVAAAAAEQHIELCMQTKVTAVRPATACGHPGQWYVESSTGVHGPFAWVVNALWQGRIAIDMTVGIELATDWSNRYREALFVRTTKPVKIPSVIIATGPFGDIKNYNNRDFYLSWYPLGLRVDSQAAVPPAIPCLNNAEKNQLITAVFEQLATFLPASQQIREHAARCRSPRTSSRTTPGTPRTSRRRRPRATPRCRPRPGRSRANIVPRSASSAAGPAAACPTPKSKPSSRK